MIFSLILWTLYALAQGVYDAGAFAYTVKHYPPRYNPHLYFLPLRALVAAGIAAIPGQDLVSTLGLMFSFSLMYPWLHDGAYYTLRGMLDVHHYRWTSTSETSTADLTLSHPVRVALFAASIFLAAYLSTGPDALGIAAVVAIYIHGMVVYAFYAIDAAQRLATVHGIAYITVCLALTFICGFFISTLDPGGPDGPFSLWDGGVLLYTLAGLASAILMINQLRS